MMAQVIAFILLILAVPFPTGNGAKVEPIGPFTDTSASESVRKALEEKGYRIVDESGKLVCQIWLRKGVPTQPKTDVEGAIYTDIAPSTLVGVLSFPDGGADYRGQAIKPGAYTLRYALLPNDGNHMGVAPYRDFLLLIPAAADQDVNAQFQFDALVKLSAKASGRQHPAPFSLVYPEERSKLPAVAEDDEGHLVFTARLMTRSGNQRLIALVVKGHAEQ